jgi:hypothetical protein
MLVPRHFEYGTAYLLASLVMTLALQLQGALAVSPSGHGLMASSPRGPSDDEGGLDPALC